MSIQTKSLWQVTIVGEDDDDERDLAGEARGEGDGDTRGEAEDRGEWGLKNIVKAYMPN